VLEPLASLRLEKLEQQRGVSDDADAVVRSDAVAIRALATWSLFDNPSVSRDCGLARFIPRIVDELLHSDSEDKR
jgi:hypothetical protein